MAFPPTDVLQLTSLLSPLLPHMVQTCVGNARSSCWHQCRPPDASPPDTSPHDASPSCLQHMVQTSKETGKKLADVWDIHDLVDDVAEQKDRWERSRPPPPCDAA